MISVLVPRSMPPPSSASISDTPLDIGPPSNGAWCSEAINRGNMTTPLVRIVMS
jgi:hypothetical protein